ncbi:rod-binding protein [Falsirhodobacter algicola]|uniref:Chemotaxis protein chel n=1 Tax=Falsirhodobacter algicola TaxID=2692330 RepID=A0A8J8MSH0_9RHOB|nr:rod-binding protein [Falsirhodobacter algicola]QUS35942.1 chemotaxis protein chel [Falsirhodobacter algicola]
MITPLSPATPQADPLRVKARQLESAFLAEMLGHAGLDATSSGGGIGEEQFASFLREAQADAMVAKGGIGLAESLFRAMGGQDAG